MELAPVCGSAHNRGNSRPNWRHSRNELSGKPGAVQMCRRVTQSISLEPRQESDMGGCPKEILARLVPNVRVDKMNAGTGCLHLVKRIEY